jgi:uncharacterized protein YjiS (DUF1127 family)
MAARSTLTQVRYVHRPTGRAFLRQAWNALTEMARARRTRHLLTEMDDRMLADIGIGRGEALMEASRAPWDVSGRR